jgi:tripartite-type tricarboxylate transporter receptor subunit TctC
MNIIKTRLAALAVVSVVVGSAAAQAFPDRPVTIIVSYPAGGANDIVARSVGEKMTAKLGQTIIVENIGGAGGTLGAQRAARAEADGYTLFMAAGAHALAPSLHKSLPYDLVADFKPISRVASSSYLVALHPSVPVNSVAELIAYAKANPGKLNFASSGVGAPPHLAGVLFQQLTGTNLVHIPYKGDTPALTDLLSGQVQLAFIAVSATKPHIDAGRLKALAVTDSVRTDVFPNMPTLDEAGVKGYALGTWWGLLAPKGVPDNVVTVMHAAVVDALKDPTVIKRFQDLGLKPVGSTPDEFGKVLVEEIKKYGEIARAAGVTPQ